MAEKVNVGQVLRDPETDQLFYTTRDGTNRPLPEISPAQTVLTSLGTGVLKAPFQVATGAAELVERGASAAGLEIGSRTSEALEGLVSDIGQRDTQLASQIRNPKTAFGGEFVGSAAAFPARAIPQALFGGLQSIGMTDDPAGEILGVGLSTLGVSGGQLAGRALQRGASNRIQAASGKTDVVERAEAFRRLQQKGFPMSRGDASPLGARGAAGRAEDIRITTRSGEATPNQLEKRRLLNQEVLDPLQVKANNISDDVLKGVDQNIDRLYQGIRDDIPNALDPQHFDDMNDWATAYIKKFRPEEPRAAGLIDDLASDTFEGRMDGRRYLQWRKDLGKAARGTDDGFARELYYGAINRLDDIFERQAGVRNKLVIANQSWRYNEVLRAPGVVSPQGNVNAQAYIRNMERMFGDVRFGTGPNQMSEAFRTVRDTQLFPGFQDSGTARRLQGGQGPGAFRTAIEQFKGAAGETAGAAAGRQAGLEVTTLGESILDPDDD